MAGQISTPTLAVFCRRLGSGLRAGLDIRQICRSEASRGKPSHRQVLEAMSGEIAKGESIAAALRHCGPYFPEFMCELVDVGERSGMTAEVLLRLADHYEHVLKMRRILWSSLTWPLIQFALAIGVIGLLILAMGIIGDITGQPVDVLGWGLIGVRGLVVYLLVLAAIAVGGYLGVRYVFQHARAFAPVMVGIMRVPGLGSYLQNLGMARVAWVLSMTTNTSMPIHRCALAAIRATGNPVYLAHAEAVERRIAAGAEIHAAMQETGAFPQEFVYAVENGEITGQLPETMQRLSREYQQRAEDASRILTRIAAFAIWALIAVFIVMMILKLALFYVGTITDLSRGF